MYTSMMRKAMLGDTALLSLDFSAGTMPTAVTFTRADSTARATYIDASGYVKTVTAAGDPRFDYTGGVAKGLLIEAAATNLLLRSQDLSAAAWTVYDMPSRTVNAATGPDNLTSATRCVFNGQYSLVYQGANTSAGITYTFSFWAKRESGNTALTIHHNNSATGQNTAFTITNDWQRYQVSVLGKTGGGFVEWGVQDRNGSGHGTILLWGTQVEESATASSLIPTSTASLTRLADDAVISGTAWTSLYAQPGAMVVEFYRGAYGVGDRSIMSTDTTATRHWHLKNANASATAQIAYSAGSATTQTGLTAGLNKVAIAWNAPSPTASFDLCVNGATPTFGGSNVGTTLSTWLTLGSQSTTGVSGSPTWDGYLNNSIKSVKYYTGLTYAEMQAKTT